MDPFKTLNNLSFEKVYDFDETVTESGYPAFLINRGLSMFLDTLTEAQEMSQYGKSISPRMHYDYLFHKVRKRKRFGGKWPKKFQSEDLDVVQAYYKCNRRHAMAALKILTAAQVEELKNRMFLGGDK